MDMLNETRLRGGLSKYPMDKSVRKFPAWHYSMVKDAARNRSIYDAISEVSLNGKIVFEIGTGSGLTAMYFAKCGAKHVYTCEVDEQLHEISIQNIARNGLSSSITIVHSSSTEYINSDEFNFSPDVVFSETLDCGVVGEGFCAVARDIATVARADTIILPSGIHQFGYLVSSEEIAALNNVASSNDYDLSALNEFSTRSYYPVRYLQYNSTTLSGVQKLRSYDYRDPLPSHTTFSIRAYRSGLCHGVISYFHALFGHSVVTNDVRDNGHWHQAFHPLAAPIEVTAGRQYNLVIFDDGNVSILEP